MAADIARFPADFIWGAATSAYQIEGGTGLDGRGESIWDRFCAQPGRIADGSSGAIACDHYHRWPTDIEILSDVGVGAYRFSIAWPRIIPAGTGRVEQAGLDFYRRLVDGLLDAGIVPYPTLYHWDLPQVLEDDGGWTSRTTAHAFADYATVVVEALGDRVHTWTTLNEPFVSASHGYITGEHAPGIESMPAGLAAAHHLLLAHGLANAAMRVARPEIEVGIVLNFTPVDAVSSSDGDQAEARRQDDFENRWFAEPIAGLGYPEATAADLEWEQREIQPGDLELIAAPIDFLGVNYYTRHVVSTDPDRPHRPRSVTDMGWEVHPPSLERLLILLHEHYGFARYLITENGAAMSDEARVDGRIQDDDRIAYLRDHLLAAHRAMEAGVPLAGYFVWSLLDNFEWAHGYERTFGIVEVDSTTLERRPKASASWYAETVRAGAIPPRTDER